MRLFLSLLLFISCSFALDYSFEVENTNIVTKPQHDKGSDYNRLRIYGYLEDERYENFLGKIIIDNENNYDGIKKDNKNETTIYRGYVKYSDEVNLVIIGKQRVPFGVGKVWNPTDIFNPIDATAIETNEREGVESIRYEYAINEVSNLDITIAKDKQALRVKGYIDIADFAAILLKDQNKNQTIYGYEMQGELYESGIELRSEGGYFQNKDAKNYEEFIVGVEYGFENSLTLLGEYKYNSLNNQDYLATNISYTISPLLTFNTLLLKNIDDKSTLSLVKFDYSLSDEMELNFGTYLYSGDKNSEYGSLDNSYFVRLFIHF